MTQILVSIRSLRNAAGFSTIVVTTMAVAIAATTAIFSAYDQLVLNPVSIPNPASRVAIWFNNPQRHVQSPSISIPRYDELRAHAQSFSSIGLSSFDSFTLTGHGEPAQLNGLRVSASFFPTLGILPAVGRNFADAEDVPNGPAVCIISHELWQTQFGGRALVGTTIELNGMPWQVVGIMPPRLTPPFATVQVFAPRVFETGGLTSVQIQAGATFAQPIGRLKSGVSIEQATAELAAFSRGYRERHPDKIDANNVTEARAFVATLVSGFQPTMYTLLGASAFVLLIACANAASLFLSRLLNRRKDVAIRLSLGATRGAILRHFLIESLVYSALAWTAGTMLALWALRGLQAVVASQIPPSVVLSLNWRALAFSGVVAMVSAVLTGLIPALQASRPNVVESLKDTARSTTSAQGHRSRQLLIVAEVMLSVMLLVGAALLITSFLRLQRTELGFDVQGIATAFVSVPPARYSTPARQEEFFRTVLERLAAQPGVTQAALGFSVPLAGSARTPYAVEGQPPPSAGQQPIAGMNIVSRDYFGTYGIPIVDGRGFTEADRLNAPPVCVINETFARHVFPDRSAVGQVLLLSNGTRRVQIVGVFRDVKTAGANLPVPDEAYFPAAQLTRPGMNLIAKTTGDPNSLQAVFRGVVADVDKSQAVSFFSTMESAVAQSLGTQRLVATLTMLFAGLAVALAVIGLYSVLAHLVSQRTAEIGVRMALGATRRQVLQLVMRSGLWLVVVGLSLGLLGAAGASGLIRQQLFEVEPLDFGTYLAVAALFLVVAAAACFVPSLRASRIDPLVAFRTE
jgi:predicted permease